MSTRTSLLGQFYSRIRGSQEDIASEGLNYLLNQSARAREGLASVVNQRIGVQMPELSYRTQVVGENQERPDIVGVDASGRELLVVEAKFWAALTENQPIEYLNRLKGSQASVLLFICPDLRVRSLWHELLQRVSSTDMNLEVHEDRHLMLASTGVTIGILTWPEVLNVLRDHLISANESNLVSDIDQIIGLCEMIDRNAFRPITDQDVAPSLAGRLISYYDITDKLVEELKKSQPVDLSGMKATAQRWGYCRYLKIGLLGVAVMVNFDLWATEVDTPFWVSMQSISDSSWRSDGTIMHGIGMAKSNGIFVVIPNGLKIPHFPLKPLLGVTEDILLKDLARQVNLLTAFFQIKSVV